MRLNLDGDDSSPNLRGRGSPSLLQQIDNSVEQEVPDAEFSEDLDLPHDSASNLLEIDGDLVELDLAPLEVPEPPAERPAAPAEFPAPEIGVDPAPAVPDVAANPVLPDIPDGPVQQPAAEPVAAGPPDPLVPIPLPAPDPAPANANAPQPPAENVQAAAAENAATTSAAPEQSPVISSNRGMKRKREDQEEEPTTVMEFNKNILRLLECPVCLEWMEPPMAQCRRGHLVCSRCRVRLFACPICRTAFSSVRNRAMEGVAEMLRYPCRHGCGRELRLRRRAPHESSCAARRHRCVAPHCRSAPMPHALLTMHYHSQHLAMVKIGRRHRFSLTLESQQHDNWVIMALRGLFHVRVDADLRSWGAAVHVAYLGPKCHAGSFIYEVTVAGAHKHRRVTYGRQTHSDLENISTNQNRQDCFHVTLDQVVNLLRNVSSSESATVLHVEVEIKRAPAARAARAAAARAALDPAAPAARPPSSSI